MSYKATAWAYEMPLKSPAKPVLVALADFADEAGSCYPGQDKIAAMTGLSVRTVRRAIELLEGYGLVRREARYDVRGHRTSDRYFLDLTAQLLPDTLTAGQVDRRSDSPSLPDTQSIPTGHSDRVTISRTTRDPSGGRETPTPTPDRSQPTVAQKLGDGHVPWCKRHPDGTDQPCAACGRARIAYEEWVVQAAKPQPRLDPSVYCEHGQFIGKCWVCDEEQRRAVAILEEQFGPTR